MTAASRNIHRRRRVYVDPTLQKRLTLGLVLLEVALIAITVAALHLRLHAAVDDSLYRVHIAAAEPMPMRLLREAVPLLGGFVAANFFALLIAESLWRGYVNAVIRELTRLVAATARLDFSSIGGGAEQHEVLVLAANWRAQERDRLLALRGRCAAAAAELRGECEPARVRAIVGELRRLLPPAPAAESARG